MSATWKLTLPETILEQLRCSMCDEYLSQLPVYSYQGQEGVVCSRCPMLSDQNPVRNVSYEIIAKFILFPCRYKLFGCLEHIVPAHMQAHEESCLHKQYFCPFMPLGFCPWQGASSDLFEHYESEHQVLALHDSSFEIDLINKYADNYLLLHEEHLFVIQLKCDTKEGKLWCSVHYIGSKKMAQQFMFQVELSKLGFHEKVSLPKKQVESDASINTDDATIVQVDTAKVREQLADPSSIICKVVILPNEEFNKSLPDKTKTTITSSTIVEMGNVDENILRDLECPVCNEYMVPPIHQCITGHSVCANCKSQLNNSCPTCRGEIGSTRNFILEKLTRHIKYGCKYRDYDCPFVSNSDHIKNHEKDCAYGPHDCPLKEFAGCGWKGKIIDVMTHARECHEDNVLEVDIINVPFEKNTFMEEYEDCFLIKAFNQIFKLYFQYQDHKFQWNVQFIGAKNDASNYMYELDIVDNSDSGQRLFVKRVCGEFTEDEHAFVHDSVVTLLDDLLIPLMSDTDLTYRCHILKK